MIKYFLDFVEIKTKLISVFSFIVAVLFYISYLYEDYGIDWINILLFFVSMLLIDMFVTALNHISAYYKEKHRGSYDEALIAEMNKQNYTVKTNFVIVIVLAILFSIIGILLVFRSNVGVLLLGMLSVFIGVIYSFGKKPIAYTPFGEVFAGAAMGVILPVIVIFTQFDHLPFELDPFIAIVFLPLAFLIGNVLFANNICDIEIDVKNSRYTLAYYTKEEIGSKLLYLSNLGAMVCITVASLLEFLPMYFNVAYLVLILLFRNVSKFSEKYCKTVSFPLVLQNFVIFCFTYMILLIIEIVM